MDLEVSTPQSKYIFKLTDDSLVVKVGGISCTFFDKDLFRLTIPLFTRISRVDQCTSPSRPLEQLRRRNTPDTCRVLDQQAEQEERNYTGTCQSSRYRPR